MYMEKNILVKNIYKWAKHGFATVNLSQKDSLLSGNIDSLIKIMFWVQQSVKKVMLTV